MGEQEHEFSQCGSKIWTVLQELLELNGIGHFHIRGQVWNNRNMASKR
jgi:hypothetical protein